jgi:uncharacterized membrane protein
MKTIYLAILSIHIAAGSLSLIAFWIPAFSKKGGKLHVLTGRYYVRAMWAVVTTAALLCVINLFRERFVTAGFLGFLSVLTAYPLWYGIAITRYKKHIPDRILNIRRFLNGLLFFGGIGLITWSFLLKFQGQTMLLLIFGSLGLTSLSATFESREKTRAQSYWITDHINGMVVSGIAAYTAFFAFGGRTIFESFLTDSMAFVPWVLPTIIGVVSMRFLRRKWTPVAKSV